MTSFSSEREEKWHAVQNQVKECHQCGLHKEGINPIFGVGSLNAQIVFIGEAPGAQENKQKKPFVGASGKVLNEFLAKIGLSRDEVFISNIVKCRPPDNRDPLLNEINACKPYLEEQINLLDMDLVVPLGRFAVKFFLPDFNSMKDVTGKVFELQKHNFRVFPMYHPATCLYNRNQYYPIFEAHFRLLKEILTQK